jgi:hypothetical protein
MAANTADGALLLVKKLGSVVLILFGIVGIAVGLEYRTIGFSAGITVAGIVALAWGWRSWRLRSSAVTPANRPSSVSRYGATAISPHDLESTR